MKNLEQQFSENLLITQPSNSVREYSDPIPYDLLVDIFSRVPAESIARFRCVSKSWASIPRLPYFTELFLTKSLTRPRILFVIEYDYDDIDELHVFSSPQPQNSHLNCDECCLVATRCKYSPQYVPSEICPPLRGLVFLHRWGRKRNGRVICNPVTGESIILPRLKAKRSYFGYDPIRKQFKVLCLVWSHFGRPSTHRVLTLGTGKRFWRSTTECKTHYALDSTEICVNGVLYYKAHFEEESFSMIACFDFSSEKFSFIMMHEDMLDGTKFMNYKGKLCAHYFEEFWGRGDELVLWVLEDAGEHKWSKRVCVLPLFCGVNIGEKCYIVGMTGTGDLVFTPYGYSSSDPFYLVFYNMERNTFTRVNIHGFEELLEHHTFHIRTFLDYVESMTTLM